MSGKTKTIHRVLGVKAFSIGIHLAVVVALFAGGYQSVFAYSVQQDYQWTKTFGGTGLDVVYGIASDQQGNVYSTGGFAGTNVNFNSAGSDIKNSNGGRDVFVTKRNADGTYGWTKTFGGTGFESPGMMASDNQGNTYSIGIFSGTATNFNSDGADIKNSSIANKYITKFAADGTYGWTKSFGGVSGGITGVSTDSLGSVYATGSFSGTNVNFSPDGVDLRSSANGTGFVTKFLADGTYEWTKTYRQVPSRISTSSDGLVVIGGSFSGTNVNFNPDASDLHSSVGSTDAFYTIMSIDGTYIKSDTFGGTTGDSIKNVRFDNQSNVYMFGSFSGTNVNFNPDASDLHSSAGGTDLFVRKILADGTYAWTKTIGSTASTETPQGLGVDSSGIVYVIGTFSTANTNFDSDGSALYTPTGVDFFINKYDSEGDYLTTKIVGGASSQNAYVGDIDMNDNLIIGGDTTGSNINFNPDGSDVQSTASQDAFMTKYSATRIYSEVPADTAQASSVDSTLADTGDSSDFVFFLGGTFMLVGIISLLTFKRLAELKLRVLEK